MSSAPCGGDAYKPYGDASYPLSRDEWTCETCAHASKEAAEDAMRRSLGIEVDVPPPYGKCMGHLGTQVLEEVRS